MRYDPATSAVYDAEHRQAFAALGMARQLLLANRETFDRLVKSARTMETAGIVLDPTLLRDYINSASAKAQVRLAEKAIEFLACIDAEIANVPQLASE